MLHFIANETYRDFEKLKHIKLKCCSKCGKYFITHNAKTKYCSHTFIDGKPCSQRADNENSLSRSNEFPLKKKLDKKLYEFKMVGEVTIICENISRSALYEKWLEVSGYHSKKSDFEKLIAKENVLFEQEIRESFCNRQVFFRDFAGEIIDIKRAAGVERSTISNYEDMLRLRILPNFGHLKISAITPGMLNSFYMQLGKPGQNKLNGKSLSAKTILEYHRLMSSIFNQAKKLGFIINNPAERASPPKITPKTPNYFQPEDLEKIKNALVDSPIMWRTIAYLMMAYGGRRGEYAGIKRQAIDFDKKELTIATCVLYDSKNGIYEKQYPKGDKIRVLPMTDEIVDLLREYLAWHDSEKAKFGKYWVSSDFIFTAEGGGMISPDGITRYFKRLSDRMRRDDPDFPHINPHAFRHTVASMLICNGADVVTTAAYIGDVPATVHQRYAHIVTGAKLEAANKMTSLIFGT